MTICYLYHICRESDKFDFHKGYIGITSDPSYRWMRHRKYEKNKYLYNCYKKYNDIVEYIVAIGSREYCLFLENKLRPNDLIGWNLVAGGGDPPSRKGKPLSDITKQKIGKSNSGCKNVKWKGWWVVDNKVFISTREAALSFSVTRKTVRDRVANPNYPNWKFIPINEERNDNEKD